MHLRIVPGWRRGEPRQVFCAEARASQLRHVAQSVSRQSVSITEPGETYVEEHNLLDEGPGTVDPMPNVRGYPVA